MARPRKGTIRLNGGKYVARYTFTDSTKQRRYRKQAFDTWTEANQWLADELYNLETCGVAPSRALTTFAQLVNWYAQNQAVPAVYQEGYKIAGLRDTRTTHYRLKLLKEYFGVRSLRSLTYGQIEEYKLHRLRQATPRGQSVKLATIHRELALLRHMLNLAVREGWLSSNPFTHGKPLIVKAHERGRERVLSFEEESRLLQVCVDERAHLRPIVICAIDTGFRANEIFSLCWSDVNLSLRFLQVRAMNSKTLKLRRVPISTRLMRELKALVPFDTNPEQLVFGIQRSVAKAWKTACRLAGLSDLRLNDLRHTFDSRLMEAGFNPLIVSRLMGHSSPAHRADLKMTYHYTHLTETAFTGAIAALDAIEATRIERTHGH